MSPHARWRGILPYAKALALQRAHRDALARGEVREEIWGLEHPRVITTGRRTVGDLDPMRIRAAGFDVFETERGGLATCHEPGQLVVYLLLDVRTLGVRLLVDLLEEGVIAWLAERGVPAHRREGAPGAWMGEAKLCAIGLHAGGGFTMHGLALNLVNDLRGFSLITPCGLVGLGVTRAADLGIPLSPEQAFPSLAHTLRERLLDARAGTR